MQNFSGKSPNNVDVVNPYHSGNSARVKGKSVTKKYFLMFVAYQMKVHRMVFFVFCIILSNIYST